MRGSPKTKLLSHTSGGMRFAISSLSPNAAVGLIVSRHASRLSLLSELPIKFDDERLESTLLYLAREHRLTAYDAAYLELAVRYTLPLATLDHALAAAARAERITIIGD